jgi:hypothetical protein
MRHDVRMNAKTKLLIAVIVVAAVTGMVLSALLAFTSTPAN